MRGRSEIANDLLVTGCTFLGTDEFRAGNTGRRQNRSAGRATGKQNHRERDRSPDAP